MRATTMGSMLPKPPILPLQDGLSSAKELIYAAGNFFYTIKLKNILMLN